MVEIRFNPCISDGDEWIRVAVDTSELVATTADELPVGENYYNYFLIHIDNLVVASCRS